jgi:predicted DNA-binding transcriptional regulator YafY
LPGLSVELGVSCRTLLRDLEFMRDRLGLPLAYHPQRWGFHYTRPVQRFPGLAVTEAELFALLVADKAIMARPFKGPCGWRSGN